MKKIHLIEAKKKKKVAKKVRGASKGVSKRTYDSKVRKYANEFKRAFRDLEDFVSTNCKGNIKKRDKSLDAICEIVDRYTGLVQDVCEWCFNSGVDLSEFSCDIMNKS